MNHLHFKGCFFSASHILFSSAILYFCFIGLEPEFCIHFLHTLYLTTSTIFIQVHLLVDDAQTYISYPLFTSKFLNTHIQMIHPLSHPNILATASVVSNSVRPHRRKPTRLPSPWDSPGKNTGVGCHFPLQCMKVKSESEVAQSCLALSDTMDCSPPGSSVDGIFQARALEWVAIAFSISIA